MARTQPQSCLLPSRCPLSTWKEELCATSARTSVCIKGEYYWLLLFQPPSISHGYDRSSLTRSRPIYLERMCRWRLISIQIYMFFLSLALRALLYLLEAQAHDFGSLVEATINFNHKKISNIWRGMACWRGPIYSQDRKKMMCLELSDSLSKKKLWFFTLTSFFPII